MRAESKPKKLKSQVSFRKTEVDLKNKGLRVGTTHELSLHLFDFFKSKYYIEKTDYSEEKISSASSLQGGI
jgi:hypothetical protein